MGTRTSMAHALRRSCVWTRVKGLYTSCYRSVIVHHNCHATLESTGKLAMDLEHFARPPTPCDNARPAVSAAGSTVRESDSRGITMHGVYGSRPGTLPALVACRSAARPAQAGPGRHHCQIAEAPNEIKSHFILSAFWSSKMLISKFPNSRSINQQVLKKP
jgi:hypothetical protein